VNLALVLEEFMHFGNFLMRNFDVCRVLMEEQCLLLLSSDLFLQGFGHSLVFQSYLQQKRLRIMPRIDDFLLPPSLPYAHEIDSKGRLFSAFTAIVNEVAQPATYM
jgi:hypothetical protein